VKRKALDSVKDEEKKKRRDQRNDILG